MQQWRTGLPCPVLVLPVLHQGAGQMRAKEEIKQLYLVLPLFLPQAATMQHWWEALARAHPQVPSKEDQNTSWGTENTFCASAMLMEVQGNTSISEHGLVQKSRFVTGPQSLSCGVEAGAPWHGLMGSTLQLYKLLQLWSLCNLADFFFFLTVHIKFVHPATTFFFKPILCIFLSVQLHVPKLK